jgi:hypothetical protein
MTDDAGNAITTSGVQTSLAVKAFNANAQPLTLHLNITGSH